MYKISAERASQAQARLAAIRASGASARNTQAAGEANPIRSGPVSEEASRAGTPAPRPANTTADEDNTVTVVPRLSTPTGAPAPPRAASGALSRTPRAKRPRPTSVSSDSGEAGDGDDEVRAAASILTGGAAAATEPGAPDAEKSGPGSGSDEPPRKLQKITATKKVPATKPPAKTPVKRGPRGPYKKKGKVPPAPTTTTARGGRVMSVRAAKTQGVTARRGRQKVKKYNKKEALWRIQQLEDQLAATKDEMRIVKAKARGTYEPPPMEVTRDDDPLALIASAPTKLPQAKPPRAPQPYVTIGSSGPITFTPRNAKQAKAMNLHGGKALAHMGSAPGPASNKGRPPKVPVFEKEKVSGFTLTVPDMEVLRAAQERGPTGRKTVKGEEMMPYVTIAVPPPPPMAPAPPAPPKPRAPIFGAELEALGGAVPIPMVTTSTASTPGVGMPPRPAATTTTTPPLPSAIPTTPYRLSGAPAGKKAPAAVITPLGPVRPPSAKAAATGASANTPIYVEVQAPTPVPGQPGPTNKKKPLGRPRKKLRGIAAVRAREKAAAEAEAAGLPAWEVAALLGPPSKKAAAAAAKGSGSSSGSGSGSGSDSAAAGKKKKKSQKDDDLVMLSYKSGRAIKQGEAEVSKSIKVTPTPRYFTKKQAMAINRLNRARGLHVQLIPAPERPPSPPPEPTFNVPVAMGAVKLFNESEFPVTHLVDSITAALGVREPLPKKNDTREKLQEIVKLVHKRFDNAKRRMTKKGGSSYHRFFNEEKTRAPIPFSLVTQLLGEGVTIDLAKNIIAKATAPKNATKTGKPRQQRGPNAPFLEVNQHSQTMRITAIEDRFKELMKSDDYLRMYGEDIESLAVTFPSGVTSTWENKPPPPPPAPAAGDPNAPAATATTGGAPAAGTPAAAGGAPVATTGTPGAATTTTGAPAAVGSPARPTGNPPPPSSTTTADGAPASTITPSSPARPTPPAATTTSTATTLSSRPPPASTPPQLSQTALQLAAAGALQTTPMQGVTMTSTPPAARPQPTAEQARALQGGAANPFPRPTGSTTPGGGARPPTPPNVTTSTTTTGPGVVSPQRPAPASGTTVTPSAARPFLDNGAGVIWPPVSVTTTTTPGGLPASSTTIVGGPSVGGQPGAVMMRLSTGEMVSVPYAAPTFLATKPVVKKVPRPPPEVTFKRKRAYMERRHRGAALARGLIKAKITDEQYAILFKRAGPEAGLEEPAYIVEQRERILAQRKRESVVNKRKRDEKMRAEQRPLNDSDILPPSEHRPTSSSAGGAIGGGGGAPHMPHGRYVGDASSEEGDESEDEDGQPHLSRHLLEAVDELYNQSGFGSDAE